MSDDEKAIRALVETWMAASKTADVQAVLDLMTEDVLFTVPGMEPFGRDVFATAFEDMRGLKIEGRSEIRELEVLGHWAYMRCHVDMTVTPPVGAATHRAGYTLSILRKGTDGRWRLSRDANLLTAIS